MKHTAPPLKLINSISLPIPDETGTGNIILILHEIRHALNNLKGTDSSHFIDLLSIPFGPGELEKLEAFLGLGEIHAELYALGKSTFAETKYSAVWLVNHFNSNDELMVKHIEVSYVPALLKATKEEVVSSTELLESHICDFSFTNPSSNFTNGGHHDISS